MRLTTNSSVRLVVAGVILLAFCSGVLPAEEYEVPRSESPLSPGILPSNPVRIGELLKVELYSTDTDGALGEFVFRNGPPIHRYLGYATFAGALGTGLLGSLNPKSNLHSTLAYVTTGLAVATTGAGIVAYARNHDLPLGHIVLSSLGTLGFAANLFIEADEDEDDGTHQIIGTAATAAFAFSMVWVIAF